MAIYVYTDESGGLEPLIPGDYTLLKGPCDEGFHVPLREERQAIFDLGLTATQLKTALHTPYVGYRHHDATWKSSDSYFSFWTVTPSTSSGGFMIIVASITNTSTHYNEATSTAKNIRAFRNMPIAPDSSWTEAVTGKIRYNSTLGLITVLVGTNQYVTLQDKNVGATVVRNDGDTLTNNNRGKYYQRGNNYGFTRNTTGTISTTRVNVSTYGPNNPYSSSTFIKVTDNPLDRRTTTNNNIRGYEDFNS